MIHKQDIQADKIIIYRSVSDSFTILYTDLVGATQADKCTDMQTKVNTELINETCTEVIYGDGKYYPSIKNN